MACAQLGVIAGLVMCPLQVVRTLEPPANWEQEHDDADHVAWLTHETVQVDTVGMPSWMSFGVCVMQQEQGKHVDAC